MHPIHLPFSNCFSASLWREIASHSDPHFKGKRGSVLASGEGERGVTGLFQIKYERTEAGHDFTLECYCSLGTFTSSLSSLIKGC